MFEEMSIIYKVHVTDENFRTLSLSPPLMEQKPLSIEISRPVFTTKMSKKKLSLVAILLLSLAEFAVCTTRQQIAFVDLEARAEDEQRELEMGVEAGGSIPSHKKIEATNGKHKGLVGDYPEAFPEAASALKEMPKLKAWSPPMAAEEDQSTTERKMAKEPKLLKKTNLTESTTKSVQSESKKEGKRTKREKGKSGKSSSKGTASPVLSSVPTSSEPAPTSTEPVPTSSEPLPTTPAPQTKGKGNKKSKKGTNSPTSVPTSSTPVPTVPPSDSPTIFCANECCSDDECPQSSVCVGSNCVQDGILRVTLTWHGIGKSLVALSQ
jgi:hypothetical protein